jgi:hypothetical protein
MTSATAPAPCNDDAIGGCTLSVRAPAPAAPTSVFALMLRTLLGQSNQLHVGHPTPSTTPALSAL